MSQILTTDTLRKLVDGWIAAGKRVAGPQRIGGPNGDGGNDNGNGNDYGGLVQYGWLKTAEQLLLTGFVRPANSIKQFVFPRHETLYTYRFQGKQIELAAAPAPSAEQIVVGARPCDAAALPILDRVFNWDCRDESYNRRRDLTTVVTLACPGHANHCFCTSVGAGPADTRGSDAILLAIDDGRYEVRCLTDKGRSLFGGQTTAATEEGRVAAGPPQRFELAAVREFLAGGYERPEWASLTRPCLGCGACAYTCPTCHCFDIIDEGNAAGGSRVRNWDACQFALFTAHASGHNPRSVQGQRQRQRIYHKFQIYPQKFDEILCTGCGNCTRNCPVNLGVLTVLKALTAGEKPPK